MKSLQKGIQNFVVALLFFSTISQVVSHSEEKISKIKK